MPLPNFAINPYVKPYVGGLSQEFGQAVQSKVGQFYQNTEQDDVLGYQADTLRQHIGPFENDQILASQALDKTRAELADRAKRGDYENMFREVKRSARKFNSTVEPLLQNKAAYDSYLKNMSEEMGKGNIGRETYQRAVQYSLDNYKGYNPSDPNSFFKGFQPTKDESASDILNKFYGDNFKGDKKVTEYLDPLSGQKIKTTTESNELPATTLSGKKIYYNDATGQYNIEGDGRLISQIELAGRQHLQGHKAFQNYLQTQFTLGNHAGPIDEVNGALQSEVQKLGYNINMNERDAIPAAWLKRYDDKIDASKPFESAAEVPSLNTHISPRFQGYVFSPNGKLQQNTDTFKANPDGTYSKFFTTDGKPLTLEEVGTRQTMTLGQYNYTNPKEKDKYKVIEQKATPEETAKLDKHNNEQFDDLVKDTFIAKMGLSDATPAQRNNVLNLMNSKWDNPQFRKQVLDLYNKAVKDFKTTETELWTTRNFANTREVGDMEVPKGQDGNSVLARNLNGRTIAVLSNNGDLKINTEGVKDINTIISKANEEGWQFKSQVANGLLKINPSMAIPGSSVTLEFTKGKEGEKQISYVNVAVGIGASDKKPLLQTLQNIGAAYLSGNGGFVPMPGMGKGGFKVINVPGQVIGANVPFVGLVQQVDSEGNNVGPPTNIQDFQDWFINQPAVRSEANSFLLNK